MSLVFGDVEITNNISGQGLSSRRPARLATTVAGTLITNFANGQSIDSVSLVTGDRILIKNQASGIENGVYIVEAAGAPARTPDYDFGDEVSETFIFIQEGATNAMTGWLCTNIIGADVVDTNPLTFVLITGDVSGSGASTNNAIVRWDGTTGTMIQDSSILVDDSNNITGLQYTQFSDITAPTNPSAGEGRMYKKTGDDGIFWKPDGAGAEVDLTTKTMILQEEGSGVTNTPHTTLNFVGARITAADAGSGVSTITVAMPVTTKGDLFTYDTGDQRLAVGTDGQLLIADSAEATGLRYTSSATSIAAAIAVQEEGGAVTGGPHSVLNFVGDNITAVDAGSGVATITVSSVSSWSAGTTGLTPNSATTGVVTLSGTLIAANGGTGFSSYTVGDIITAGTTTTFAKVPDVATGNVLISGGVGVVPSYGKVALTTHVSGILPIANGGTQTNTAPTTGQVLLGNGGGTYTPTDLSSVAVTSWSAGTTGLTPSSATTSAVTLSGTLIAVNGGTGFSSYTVGDIITAGTATTFAKVPDVATGNVLISGGVGVVPSYGKVALTTHVSGILPIANGGTNLSTAPTNGQLLVGNGTDYTLATLTAGLGIDITNASGSITVAATGLVNVQEEGSGITGTPHSVLNFIGTRITATDSGSGVAAITVVTPVTTKGDVYTYDTDDARLAVGSNGQFLRANSATGTGLEWGVGTVSLKEEGTLVTGGPHDIINFVGTRITATDAGSGEATVTVVTPVTTKGDVYTYDTDDARLAVGGDGQFLRANSATGTGLEWGVGTISLQEEGTLVTGGPHDVINFLGTRITATDAGSGVASVTVVTPVAVKGDIYTYDTDDQKLAVGTNNDILMADSSTATGLKWNPLLLPSQIPAGIISDTIAADQNNYNPTDIEESVQVRITATGADRSITGILISGTEAIPVFSELKLTNVGTTYDINLREENVSSTAANRFLFDGQDVVIRPGQSSTVFYDFTTLRWRCVATSQDGRMGGMVVNAGVITPPSFAVDQDDYTPTGLELSTVLRVEATALSSITGLAGGVDGRVIYLVNVGIIPITLPTLSTASIATNRFYTGTSDATLVGNATVTIIYDETAGYWRITGGTGGVTSGAGGLVQSQWVEVTEDLSTTETEWPSAYTYVDSAATLPQSTINVDDTTAYGENPTTPGSPGFPTSGTIIIQTIDESAQIIRYTGKTNGSFTGCTGGIGDMANGSFVHAGPVETTVAAGSDGDTLPQATINVVATADFPSSGRLLVTTSVGTEVVFYTGVTATTFTGCTGGAGDLSTGDLVVDVSPTAQDVMEIIIKTAGGAIIVSSTANASTDSNKTGYFQLTFDGFIRRGASTQGNGGSPAGSAVIGLKLENVDAGDHVITVRWVIEGGDFAIFPVTEADHNNASLLVQEVSS
jgi:tRNA A58 N-methylase Trm61